jgi:hypothetical protein
MLNIDNINNYIKYLDIRTGLPFWTFLRLLGPSPAVLSSEGRRIFIF